MLHPLFLAQGFAVVLEGAAAQRMRLAAAPTGAPVARSAFDAPAHRKPHPQRAGFEAEACGPLVDGEGRAVEQARSEVLLWHGG